MDKNTSAISVRNLTKRFGNFSAVDGIEFDVNRGEIFGFLGPNGSGKTTTIRMLLGLIKPSAGSVMVLGMDVARNAQKIRPQVGYMSQRFSLYNDLTVMQNLNFYGAAYGVSEGALTARIDEVLSQSGLQGRQNTKTRDLSGGWRQRLALNACILHRPQILFLDEPTAGVDPLSRRAFWDLLYQLAAEGVTVFVTTHYMDEAEHCHRLAFIQRGKIIASGRPSEIKASVMGGQVLELAPSEAVQAIKVLRSLKASGEIPIRSVELYGSLVHVIAPEIERLKPQIIAALRQSAVEPGDASFIEPSLEDVFIAAMKE